MPIMPARIRLPSLIVLTCALLAPATLHAQARDPRGPDYFVSGFAAIPVSGYADEETGGGATLGGGLSGGVLTPLSGYRAGFFLVESYYLHNPMDVSGMERQLNAEVEGGGWNHYGVLAGLRLTSLVAGDEAGRPHLYVQVNGGFNISNFSDLTIRGGSTTLTQSADPAFSPAVGMGVGFRDRRFGIGVRYLNFGEPHFDLKTRDANGGAYTITEVEQSLGLFTVGAEFYF
jgi:hypothetical protein